MLPQSRRFFPRVARRAGGADLLVLLSLFLLTAGIVTFLGIAGTVRAGATQQLDERILLSLRDPANPAVLAGPPWMAELGRDLTAVGGVAFLFLGTASVAGFLLLCREYRVVVGLLATVGGGLLLCASLKGYIDRPRPALVPHLSRVSTTSFPSGHSMLSAVVYTTLGLLLGRLFRPTRLKLYFLAVALLLSFLVGVSRVYLGVHYPTDVLASWAAGLAWTALCRLLARPLRRVRAVEKPQ